MSAEPEIPSTIGRLLAEISWEGANIRSYRAGGRGFENVLTAEALQALDLLPRTHFLGHVLGRVHGAAETCRKLIEEVEAAEFRLLPGNHYLRPSAGTHQTKVSVQPDAILKSPSVYSVVEAKRLRRGAFQAKQLAREYVLALEKAGAHRPLLVLLLPEPPPVPVKGHGRMTTALAISTYLHEVYESADELRFPEAEALERIDEVICWITWHEVLHALTDQLATFESADTSVRGSMARMVGLVQAEIAWHGDG